MPKQSSDQRYREIRRADAGGRSLLEQALNPDQITDAFAELLLSNPHIIGPLVLALRQMIPKYQAEGAQPSLTMNSEIGFVYFGRIDMAQAQRQRETT